MSERHVTQTEAQALADEYNLDFLEISAKAALNIEKAFFNIAKNINEKIINQQEEPPQKF